MPLDPQDHQLSMRISPRPKAGRPDPEGLRTIIVHRLNSTVKAVVRRPLRQLGVHSVMSAYCEMCDKWIGTWRSAPKEFTCDGCGLHYRQETVIYQEVPSDDDE